jgi:hypothetical protein
VLLPSAGTAIVLGGLLVWLAATGPIGPATFSYLILAALAFAFGVGLLLYAVLFRSLTYHLDRNGLQIRAGGWVIAVPMESITGIYALPQNTRGDGFRGLRFPGHNVGRERSRDGTTFVSAATAPPEDCLYVRAGTRVYAVSPEEPDAFRRTYEMERALGPLRSLRPGLEVPRLLQNLFWRDRLGRTLTAVALLGALILLGLAFWLYPGLPEQVPMHFDQAGQPDRLAPPTDIFYLPLVGFLVLVANSLLGAWVYGRERVLSYFAWSGAVLVQLILIFALRATAA